MSNLRNPVGWIPGTKAWRNHKAAIRRVLAVMRGLLQEVHNRLKGQRLSRMLMYLSQHLPLFCIGAINILCTTPEFDPNHYNLYVFVAGGRRRLRMRALQRI